MRSVLLCANGRSASEFKERSYSAGAAGKYVCSRCGWQWTPRQNSRDPPGACARCRSAYWQSTPVSCRANSPSDPRWRAKPVGCKAQAKAAPHEAERAGSRVRFRAPADSLRPKRCAACFPAATKLVSAGGAKITFQRARSIRPKFRPCAAKVLGRGVASPHGSRRKCRRPRMIDSSR